MKLFAFALAIASGSALTVAIYGVWIHSIDMAIGLGIIGIALMALSLIASDNV